MIIDKLKNASLYYGMSEKIATALKYLENTDLSEFQNGKYEIEGEDISVIVQDYNTKPLSEGRFEAHRKYIDIQYIIKGTEKMGYTNIHKLKSATEYDEEKDIIFFDGEGDFVTVEEGFFTIFAPEDAHMPGIESKTSEYIKKAVVKIKV
ncbi:MAG TPA: YhcH/YjgK/YiaL family protein [Cyanobacteria bacterium UBA9971]|nr:YhcH/YjgK/YiaL family protein [Cyanobacteria bacterium UBA9971]